MKDRKTFYFTYHNLNRQVNPMIGSRISIWMEDDPFFLMPCEFKEVIKGKDFYKLGIILLDAESFSFKMNLGKKFFFGPPNHEIGYGILNEIKRI